MISITCTQCQTVLTIDDAFAGGVCRCQHCGTIQTVPSALKATPTPQPYAGPSATQPKTLYQTHASRTGAVGVADSAVRTSSGLDDLAQAVGTSSGGALSGSGLRGAYVAPGTPPASPTLSSPTEDVETTAPPSEVVTEPRKLPLIPILVGVGAIIVVLLGVIIYLLVHHSSPGGTVSPGGGGTGDGTPTLSESFGGISVSGSRVVYLLDDANSIAEIFDPVRAATLQSVRSLGPDRKFAVILWNNGDQAEFAFPKDGLAAATPSQVNDLRSGFQDINATGQSSLRPSLESAMARNPDAIIIVTAKTSLETDDQNAIATAQEKSGGKIKLYAFNVGSADEDPVLKMAAKATGGDYKHFTSQEVRDLTP